jgi:hypothetical protein
MISLMNLRNTREEEIPLAEATVALEKHDTPVIYRGLVRARGQEKKAHVLKSRSNGQHEILGCAQRV